jgi:hypothetical protein
MKQQQIFNTIPVPFTRGLIASLKAVGVPGSFMLPAKKQRGEGFTGIQKDYRKEMLNGDINLNRKDRTATQQTDRWGIIPHSGKAHEAGKIFLWFLSNITDAPIPRGVFFKEVNLENNDLISIRVIK